MQVKLKKNWREYTAGDVINIDDQKTLTSLLGTDMIYKPSRRRLVKPIKKKPVKKKAVVKKTTATKSAVKKPAVTSLAAK